ncbi:MAG: hypothetical protein AAGB46_04580 [Verrucomicrobiota bacterium]
MLPPLENIRDLSKHIAKAVALKATEEGVTLSRTEAAVERLIEKQFWTPPIYGDYRYTSL